MFSVCTKKHRNVTLERGLSKTGKTKGPRNGAVLEQEKAKLDGKKSLSTVLFCVDREHGKH